MLADECLIQAMPPLNPVTHGRSGRPGLMKTTLSLGAKTLPFVMSWNPGASAVPRALHRSSYQPSSQRQHDLVERLADPRSTLLQVPILGQSHGREDYSGKGMGSQLDDSIAGHVAPNRTDLAPLQPFQSWTSRPQLA